MNPKPIRVYADTSVYGGVFDEEYEVPSRLFFEKVRLGQFNLILSPVVREELETAPTHVKGFFQDYYPVGQVADVTEEVIRLQQAYLRAAIVGPRWETDALHVALATVAQCRLIVSWNFKHIVNFHKIPLYNGVNLAQGYGVIGIHTPQEMVTDEDEDL